MFKLLAITAAGFVYTPFYFIVYLHNNMSTEMCVGDVSAECMSTLQQNCWWIKIKMYSMSSFGLVLDEKEIIKRIQLVKTINKT